MVLTLNLDYYIDEVEVVFTLEKFCKMLPKHTKYKFVLIFMRFTLYFTLHKRSVKNVIDYVTVPKYFLDLVRQITMKKNCKNYIYNFNLSTYFRSF